ncbi:MAG TPA: PKD domain-containing protein [Methanoregulaceae archaeon]|nr:PKD domain-containing protein [Methanoregulaceae archaeon]
MPTPSAIISEGQDDALEQLILEHGNETPNQEMGTLTVLDVGEPGYDKQHLFCSGDWVGWVESLQYNYRIRLYNLKSSREMVIPLNGTDTFYYPVSMDGENIVYTGNSPEFSTSSIYLYNITTNTTTIFSDGDQDTDKNYPVIEGRYVVYTVERYDWSYIRPSGFVNMYSNIQLHDLVTGQDVPISPVSNATRRESPSISGDNAVWVTEDWDTAKKGIELYNIPNGTLLTVDPDTGDFGYGVPSIYQYRIVWQKFDSLNWQYDVYLLNLTSQKKTLITPGSNTTSEGNPSIWDGLVVYENDPAGNPETIWLLNLSSGERSEVTPDMGVYDPLIMGDHIFWRENGNFMMFTRGNPQKAVKADFLVNNTVGGLPLTVRFTDKSSGPVVTHHWEFGDGNESYEVNPVHTYTTPGRYDVSMTVSTPYYRDNKYVSEMITAGTAPRASFITDPPSGVAGLTVHFNDTSTGYSDRWSWDFGDNYTSTEENTSHRYISPGDYNLTFSSGNQWGTDTVIGTIQVINATFGETPVSIPGIIQYSVDTGNISMSETDLTGYAFALGCNSTRLELTPENGSSSPSFSLFSSNGTTFHEANKTIAGTVKNISLTSADLTSREFSDPTSFYNWLIRGNESLDEVGPNSTVNFTIDLDFQLNSSIDTAVCRQYTNDEESMYTSAVQVADWADGLTNIAYVLHCTKNNLTDTGPATITMSVSHEWVVNYSQFTIPENRIKLLKVDENGQPLVDNNWNYIYFNVTFLDQDPVTHDYQFLVTDPDGINVSNIEMSGIPFSDSSNPPISLVAENNAIPLPTSITFAVNSDYVDYTLNTTRWHYVQEPMTIIRVNDTGATEVLDTKFLYYDPVKDVDVFQAYSPHGLSEFALAPVYTAGNPLQLFYLSVVSRVTPLAAPINKPVNRPASYASGGGGGSYGGSGSTVTSSQSAEPAAPSGTSSGSGSNSIAPGSPSLNSPPSSETEKVVPAAASSENPAAIPQQIVVSSQGPGISIFTVFVEAAAAISVFLLVVVSIYTRYRKFD